MKENSAQFSQRMQRMRINGVFRPVPARLEGEEVYGKPGLTSRQLRAIRAFQEQDRTNQEVDRKHLSLPYYEPRVTELDGGRLSADSIGDTMEYDIFSSDTIEELL